MFSFYFSPQKNYVCFLQNTAKLKSMNMQMITDKMHFDTIAFRRKMQFEKWMVATFAQCTLYMFPVCFQSQNKKCLLKIRLYLALTNEVNQMMPVFHAWD